MRHLTVTLALLLVSVSLVVAQDRPVRQPPDSTRGTAAAQFRDEHGADWQLLWHAKAGTPAALLGGTARGYAGPPEQAGRAFLQDHRALFGIDNPERDLKATRTNASRGNNRVLYQQVYRGLPVLYSGYLVALNQSGSVYYVSGDYYPDLRVERTTPSLAPSSATSQIRADLGGGASFSILQEPLLSIYVDDEGEKLSYHLAYEARAERRDPLDAYKYVIDAQTGDVLQKISLINEIHGGTAASNSEGTAASNSGSTKSRAAGKAMATGTGEVYLTNPLHGSPVQVTLHRLDDVSPRVLEGDHIAVTNEEEPEATSPTGTFVFSPTDTHFDEVMTYYHSDEFEQWLIDDLGMASGQLGCQIEAETHSSNTYAGTLPPPQCEVFLSDGEGFSLPNGTNLDNPTQERSIITHEYMHAVSEPFNSLEQNFEADALDEGYSDFFAVADRHANTSVSSTQLGESVGFEPERTVGNTYQLNDFFSNDPDTRDLTNNGSYSEHDGGVVLAGALWDATQAIGDVTLSAEVTLESLNNLDGDPSFFDARTALVAADQALYSGQHGCEIEDAFADHGIGQSPLDVTVSGDGILYAGETGHWSTYVECFGGSASYEWAYREAGESGWTIIMGANSSTLDHSFCTDVTLRAVVTSNLGTASDDYDVSVSGGCSNAMVAGTGEAPTQSEARVRPEQFRLGTSVPNPVRTQTTIRYALPEAADVTLTVYDVLGREVARLVDDAMPLGFHEVQFDASGLPSGTYLYRLQAGRFVKTKRVVVIR